MKRLLIVLALVIAGLNAWTNVASAQNATETVVIDDDRSGNNNNNDDDDDDVDDDDDDDDDRGSRETLDPDDIVMELPGLPPLPDPSTVGAAGVRTPRTPRSASGTRDDVLPSVRRELPASGRDTRSYALTGVLLAGTGAELLFLGWTIRRRRRAAIATDGAGSPDAPAWGTDSIIGW